MSHLYKRANHIPILLGLLLLSLLLLSACSGGESSTPTSSSNNSAQSSVKAPSAHDQASSGSGTSSNSKQGKSTSGNQNYDSIGVYLIKSLIVDMAVPDTQKTATNLQNWLNDTDPKATSAGISYDQISDNHYAISLKYSVEASKYDQVRNYLASYPPQQHGKLLDLHENVQDVTNDYVDTQARIKNLQIEQRRLQTILSNANTIGDVIDVESRLADVEGQLEQINAHMKSLQGQTTFYDVTINLRPLSLSPSPSQVDTSWNPGKTLSDAWNASLAFGQALLTILFWLLSFAPYLLVIAAVVAGALWWRKRQMTSINPTVTAPAANTSTTPGNTP